MHRRGLQSADSGHDDNADGAPFQQDERITSTTGIRAVRALPLECRNQAIIRAQARRLTSGTDMHGRF